MDVNSREPGENFRARCPGDFAELYRIAIGVAAWWLWRQDCSARDGGSEMIAVGFLATLVLSMVLLFGFAANR